MAYTDNALSASGFRLLDGIGELCFVLQFEKKILHEDDAFAVALTCRTFYNAVCRSHPPINKPRHAFHHKRFITRRRGVVRSVQLLAWATEECGLSLSTRICMSAAQDGQLAVLKWARKRGCDWDVTTCQAAAAAGHQELLEWAYAHGAPIDTHCAMLSYWSQHKSTFRWLVGDDHAICDDPPDALPFILWGGFVAKVAWRREFSLTVRLALDAQNDNHAQCRLPLKHHHHMGVVMAALCNHYALQNMFADLEFYVRRSGAKIPVGPADNVATLRLNTQDTARSPMLYVRFKTQMHDAAGHQAEANDGDAGVDDEDSYAEDSESDSSEGAEASSEED